MHAQETHRYSNARGQLYKMKSYFPEELLFLIFLFIFRNFLKYFSFFSVLNNDVEALRHPEPKRKLTSEKHRSCYKEYHMKHGKRASNADWKVNQPWLIEEEKHIGSEVFFCNFCIKTEGASLKNAFIKGYPNFMLETMKYHEGSNSNMYAAQKHANEKNPYQAPECKAELSLNKVISAVYFLFGQCML